jgi:ABC-2 type transport system permease protein
VINVNHAELIRLVRRRTVVVIAAGSLLFAVVATLTVFSTAQESGSRSRRGGTTVAALADRGGGTEAFAVGASFLGFCVFVTFIALIASEFSGGTYRALLLRNPHRLRVITGKLAGILLVAAAAAAFAEASTFVMSLVAAPSNDVSIDAWFSVGSVGAAVRDYVTVFSGVAGWAIFGTTLAVIFGSTPLALGVGFAWAGPFENITVDLPRDRVRV